MKNFKFLFLFGFLLFAKLSQAVCFPTSYTPETYSYNYTNSASNNVFNSLWFVRFDLKDTDVCRFEFLRGDSTNQQNIALTQELFILAYLSDRFSNIASTTNAAQPGAFPGGLNVNYSSADTTVSVTTTGNNFNTSNSSCWCDRTSNNAPSTCSIQGLSAADNQVPAHSLMFKKCSATNTTVPVFIKLRWIYRFNADVTSFEYCPKDSYKNLADPSDISPVGDDLMGPGTTDGSVLCQRVFVSRPTCALNIPSQVNLPTIKPSSTVGVRQESKKPIAIQLVNCVNSRPTLSSDLNNAFPKVVLTDSNGPSTDCYLKNMASTNNGGNSSTNNTVIALSLNQDFSNEVCLLDFSASRNNVLTFGGAPLSPGSGVKTFSQTIWAALRVSGSSPTTEVGKVRSKLMLKIDYE